jgi:dehydrogenase/reductase SDR family protein 12
MGAALSGGAPSAGYSLVAVAQWFREGSVSYGRAGFERAARGFSAADDAASLDGAHVIVTGANRGLGLAMARALGARAATVHLVVRDAAAGAAAREAVVAAGARAAEVHVCDVGDAAAVRAFAARFEARALPLAALVLNAGFIAKAHALSRDGLEPSWAAAVLQSYLLVALLAPSLARAAAAHPARTPAARVVHVSSGGGLTVGVDAADAQGAARAARGAFDGALQYAHAKRAQMALARAWARRLPRGVGSYAMHPGWADTDGVRTSLPDFHAARAGTLRTAEQGADTAVWLAAAPALPEGVNGALFFDRAVAREHFPLAGTRGPRDEEAAWELAERAVGAAWEGGAR